MAKIDGVPRRFSQRFTLENVTPTLAANCFWVRLTWRAGP
jgi:hypothetical protein